MYIIKKILIKFFLFFLIFFSFSLQLRSQEMDNGNNIVVGAERTSLYVPLLEGKKVGIVANQTSLIGKTHLVDSLLSLKVNIRAIYCPEHGFRGEVQAGGKVSNSIDKKTNIPIISLYGKNKKPQREEFANNDIVIFDIQDVGCRFYTYISTLHYVMEACAETNIPLLVLDRANPNGFYIDGPVIKDTSLVSFVGMHPVPVVYGMTIGEYAQMINSEGWLNTSSKRVIGEKTNINCNLTIIPLENYTHNTRYTLPISPSPNLKTKDAILLYPSLCWFEGTPISLGRGTEHPFEIVGFPMYENKTFSFTPKTIIGVAENPPYDGIECYGVFLSQNEKYKTNIGQKKINLSILIDMYRAYPKKGVFFTSFFDKLSGTKLLKEQIKNNFSEEKIRKTWIEDLNEFKQMRSRYLLYK
ncbi:MAG: DUF1343 domain-containing protein [Bacteroidales bacterium]|jgi:uncharacterized protein YbbC (DUF1343 family)|nr:DUF1343 domain-containing protein [Bacteroidales bacterium]